MTGVQTCALPISKSKPPWLDQPASGAKTESREKTSGGEKSTGGAKSNSPVKAITDQLILELLLEDVFEEPTDYGAVKIQSLKKAGVQSEQSGVLVTMDDGTAYEIVIKKVK